MSLHTIETPTPHPDDDFLFDDGLPCLRRDGRLYYLGDMQPRVLEACRHFEIGFDQLADKLGMTRPALVLILKGYDSVSPPLKSMIDRLLGQAGQLAPLPGDIRAAKEADAEPIVTTIHAVPVPESIVDDDDDDSEAAITVTAEDVPEVIIPPTLAPGRPALVAPALPPAVFAPGLAEFTPGLRRAPYWRNPRRGL